MKNGILLFLVSTIACLNMAQANTQQDIETKLDFKTSVAAIVLPNKLSSIYGQTCNGEDVYGPRVRLRASINWQGNGMLLPLVISIHMEDSNLNTHYVGTISPSTSSAESLAFMFSSRYDYIPADKTIYTTSTCFLDYGNLPTPLQNLKGTERLIVPVKVIMSGVVRDANSLEDTAFTKVFHTELDYLAGSVPR